MTNPSWRSLALGVLALLICLPSIADPIARSRADRVNVRSRPGYAGEVITQLERGEEVRVTGTNTLSRPAVDEPPVWYKIELPVDAPLWVSAEYVNPQSGEVTADILNVRAGPGLDYAVVARVPRGGQVRTRGSIENGWVQIEAPPGALGYVPANWVTFEEGEPTQTAQATDNASRATPEGSATAGILAPRTSRPLPPVPLPSSSGTPSAPAAGQMSAYEWSQQFLVRRAANQPSHVAPAQRESFSSIPAPGTPVAQGTVPADSGVALAPGVVTQTHATEESAMEDDSAVPPAPVMPENSDARWVRREGLVIRPFNFAAPTFYALEARDSGKTINFLFTSRAEPINWREYRGKVVILTGREYLDKRTYWRGVPLLDVEEIEAVR
jgi:uncharacterized protein YraI